MAFTDLIQLPFSHLDNDEFNLAIFEFNQGRINFDIDRLESLHFNPLSNDNLTLQSFDIDPDQQFYTNSSSHFYVSDQFNELSNKFSSSFSLLHLNARSLNHNLSRLTDFLNSIDLTFSVIGITETWLQDTTENDKYNPIQIPGYNFIHNYRKDKKGGGVGFFINHSIEYRHDLEFFDCEVFESIFIEIEMPKQGRVPSRTLTIKI